MECNYLSWHYTGWNPNDPEQGKWGLGRMREFIDEYKEQKIREVHCDEWGAGPDKPGRLEPGRAIVWFYYLEDIYKVDRACRADWGKEDDYLGGIITPKNETFPVYVAYKWYGTTKGQTRVAASGNSKTIAALASKTANEYEVLLGSVEMGVVKVALELKGRDLKNLTVEAHVVGRGKLDQPMDAGASTDGEVEKVEMENTESGLRVVLPRVGENEAWHIVLRAAKSVSPVTP